MDEVVLSTVLNEVIVGERSSGDPSECVATLPPSTGPVVASVPIAGGVLVVHVVPQALHNVSVQDVGEGEGLSKLR